MPFNVTGWVMVVSLHNRTDAKEVWEGQTQSSEKMCIYSDHVELEMYRENGSQMIPFMPWSFVCNETTDYLSKQHFIVNCKLGMRKITKTVANKTSNFSNT